MNFRIRMFVKSAVTYDITIKKPRRLIVDQPFPYSQKEEKMFSKVTLPSTLIFPAKDVCTINLTFLVTYICIRNRVRSVSL